MAILVDERTNARLPASKTVTEQGDRRSRRAMHFAIKRCIDIAGSATALIILAPVLLLVALVIRLESPGSALFTQERWGRNGKRIKVYKFRSMRKELSDATGVAQTVKNDPRVTRFGALLRRTNFDELPQLINVLKGDMSLVGPRCHPIGMLAAGVPYEELVDNYHQRHAVRPGITGLAQMRGLRGPTISAAKSRQRIAADIYYVQNFDIWLDVKILLGTMKNEVFGGSGF